ncbi:MAG: hypothetical protein GY719_12275 [bacterium]|nr:hypothetical protein [bacterium]
MRRFPLLYVAPTLLLLALAVSPLIRGSGTLYTRDVLSAHYPMKVAHAEALRAGELPLIDPYRAGGQPLLGNPNALPLYPDNVLYLVASPLWALNAHFWLHLLLAPLAFYWLGRAWGLSRPAAWAGGVCYVASGFFLSLLNLYNLVAGAALAPAFVAAWLDATRDDRRRWLGFAGAGALWGLLLLAGDPLFAALGLLLALSAVLVRGWSAGSLKPHLLPGLAALACGTLLAAPMLIELARILPLSYRGYWQFSIQAALSQSWDPRSVLEWLLPFFFGRPDFTFWGFRYYGGNPPLYFSFYPGLLSLGLIATCGRPRRPAAWWAWGATGAGLFLAAGAWNPAVRLLYHLPGASALRYPVKMWLLVAVGAALLCALGFERLLDGGRRRLRRVLGVMTVVYLATWGLLLWMPPALMEALRALDPARLNTPTLIRESGRWVALGFFTLVTLALLWLAFAVTRKRPFAGGALLLVVHLASQGFFLSPLYHSDAAGHYTRAPEILAAVPEDALVVYGGHHDLFGKPRVSPLTDFPDPRFFWLSRRQAAQLHPLTGIAHGRRYDLNHSPEGLDSFFSLSLARAIQGMDDVTRVRLLAASGVDTLILDRALDPAAPARLVTEQGDPPAFVYRLPGAAPRVGLAGTVLRAPQMNRALEILGSDRFDPGSTVVLPGDGEEARGAAGRVEVTRDEVHELEVDVASEAGGVLFTQRAFLDVYRASVDGEPAEPVVTNMHRLGVEVPPGEHRVRLWVDRWPSRLGWLGALVGAAVLVAMAIGRKRKG